ncbi:LysR substrate-binding domain-containing protein [Cupriavidus basilensis]|uniref:LysR substrate-binding domain-containing protein n=1 Tax=Cupriavidus basilensis TaxID=68895 RepID=UPI00283C87BF|nr:LysR substrate-binding domain-containing protein [Cupriavidus basilensis]MDR3381839.1 LysR substrate-binding domain-containing protein [Cupriavidus basilensis]
MPSIPCWSNPSGPPRTLSTAPGAREHGFQFKKVFATNSLTVLRAQTIEGLGISQLALDYFATYIEQGLLRVVKSDTMPPPLVYSAMHRDDAFSAALDVIAEGWGSRKAGRSGGMLVRSAIQNLRNFRITTNCLGSIPE